MDEMTIAFLLATAGGIVLSGGLFSLGSLLRRRLRLPNDPPEELAWFALPPTATSSTPQERRSVMEQRQTCGAHCQSIHTWLMTIEAALASLPELPDAACEQSQAGSREALTNALQKAYETIEAHFEIVKKVISDFDGGLQKPDLYWSSFEADAQRWCQQADAAHQAAHQADQAAEAAWHGIPNASNQRLWWLLGALVAALLVATITLLSRPS
jgi:hypothetical protein